MSRRSDRRARKAEALAAGQAEATRKRSWHRRFRVTLLAGAACVAMLIFGLIQSRTDPRLSLVNRTGGTISEIRVVYPGGVAEHPAVPDNGRFTLTLAPTPGGPKPDPDTWTVIEFLTDDGKRFSLRTRTLGRDRGTHQILDASRTPDGLIRVVPADQAGGPGGGFRDLLRSIGIRL